MMGWLFTRKRRKTQAEVEAELERADRTRELRNEMHERLERAVQDLNVTTAPRGEQ